MKKIFPFIIAALFTGPAIAQKLYTGSKAVVNTTFIYQKNDVPFPECHASTVVETGEGLMAAWFGGTEEKHHDVCIYTARRLNGKWEKPALAADGKEDGTKYPCWNPVLFKRDNSDLILYYKVGPDPRSWWGMYKISTDQGKTWSAAEKIPDNLLGPIKNKPVRLNDGTILYPTSFETRQTWQSYMEISDQDLKTWKKVHIDNGNYQTIQPTILFHPGGSLQILCRSKNKVITEAWSRDNGKSWSEMEASSLPNNNSGIDAVTLADGRHLLVYTPDVGGRNILGLAASKDGKVWEAAVLLENDPNPEAEYSYPAIIQAQDGLLHITYTWNRKLIRHVVINPAELQPKPFQNGKWPEE